ncbi:FYN-binding protein 2 [Microcaecilia unicolor]|uniref:FYN-binding protein 2 n=1 Tax=Microcaecilia unicolor TaxID=1415580 RepID=A0A6P7Y909_9AMPH|nr:FYN-binding protein 2 [Microcaecilia unicolor]
MDTEEMLTDFKTLRARFQNVCPASNTSTKPTNRLQWNTLQERINFRRAGSDANASKKGDLSMSPESNTGPFHPGDPKPPELPAFSQVTCSTLDLKQKKKNALEASPARNFLSKVGLCTQRETSTVQKQKTVVNSADTVSHNTFKQKLQIWESAASHADKKQEQQPPRHTRTKPLNSVLSGPTDVCTPAESSQRTTRVPRNGRIIMTSNSNAVPHQEQLGSGYPFSKAGNCATTEPTTNVLYIQMLRSECSDVTKSDGESDVRKGQYPQLRSLPSIEVLGPPPKKPVRPPQVDLGPFLRIAAQGSSEQILEGVGAQESDYVAPENDDPEMYDDELELQKSLNSIKLYPVPKVKTYTSETGIPENKVLCSSFLFGMTSDEPDSYEDHLEPQRSLGSVHLRPFTEACDASTYETDIPGNEGSQSSFLFGVNRPEKTDTGVRWKKQKIQKDEHLSKAKDKKENELKKNSSNYNRAQSVFCMVGTKDSLDNITGFERILYKAQINEDCKAGKDMLPLKQGDTVDIIQITSCPSGKWLAKDENGNVGYVHVKVLKVDEETIAASQWSLKPREIVNGIYDAAEGMENELSTVSLSPSFSSDSFSEESIEETYDDVQADDTFTVKSVEDGKPKRLGKFFMKEKLFKLKNYKPKEKLDNLSVSMPNLEDIYDDIEPNPKISIDKDVLKNWMRKFPMPKETEKRRSSEVCERNIFKNMLEKEKNKKMTKEEKLFREKFEYTKEIVVLNTATVDSSVSALKRGKLDLRITEGETLDVIDIADNNQIICRNSEGKYGYVSVEHLTFWEG